MFVVLLNRMDNSEKGTHAAKCHCNAVLLLKRVGVKCPIENPPLSDDDFVENPYGYGLKKKIHEDPPTPDFVPCTYTSKASTSSGVTNQKPAAKNTVVKNSAAKKSVGKKPTAKK